MSGLDIRPLLRSGILSLAPETPIRRAVALLVEARTPAAAVIAENGALAGILTQKDCFRPALHASYHQEWAGTVADHMTRAVVTIDAGTDLAGAAEMFLASPHRVFPAMDGARLVGLLHRSDVLAALVRAG